MSWLGNWLFHPMLAAGAAAIALPILIHILSRRRFQVVRWAAMDFLLSAARRNRRRVRLEQLILLALRCLVVVLLALMVARPFVRPGSAMALLGSGARTERIVVLDDSFSMGYRIGAGETVFGRACRAVERFARWMSDESPMDTLTVVRTSAPAQPIAALPDLSEESLGRLQDVLSAASPSDRPSNLDEALRSVARMAAQAPVQANLAIYIVSDMQLSDWLPGEATTAPSTAPAQMAVRDALAELMTRGRDAPRLTLVDVGAERPANVAVTAIEATTARDVAGVRSRFEIGISNFSDAPVGDAELRLSIADQALPPVILPRLAPRQTLRQSVEVAFTQEGFDRLLAELILPAGVDRLPLDDRRAVGLTVASSVPVLIVNGEPSADGYRDEVLLLRTALAPPGRVSSGFDVRVITDEQLETTDLRGYDAIVLANVYRVDEPAQRRLESYVRDGGGLVIFLGDQVDPGLYNERLYADGRGLLPAELLETVNAPGSDGQSIAEYDASHPVLRAFAGEASELLRGTRFYAYYGARPAGDTPMATSPATQESGVRPAASVLARLDDPDRSPLLIERVLGAGRVVLCTSTADLEWNSWGRDPSFVPVMLQLAQHVARRDPVRGQVTVGEPIRLPLDPSVWLQRAILKLPTYPSDPPLTIDARSVEGGLRLEWERTERAGLHQFELQSTRGESSTRVIAVNPDPRESDLRRATADDLRSALGDVKFDYVRDIDALTGDAAGARRELWWPIALLVVALLMVEHGLARQFGARG